MIYRDSFFKKEIRLTKSSSGFRQRLLFGFFLGLFSFALYFALQTLQESVVSQTAPQIMQKSFFSTITIYIYVSFLFISGYFIVFFDMLFFSEIRRNAWYMLVQMGYRPYAMIAAKFIAQSYSVFVMYLIGFSSTALLTVFIKASFVYAYMSSLFAAGLLDLMLMTVACMVISLFVKTIGNARYLIILAVVAVLLLKWALGMSDVLSDRETMESLKSFVRGSIYLPVSLALIAMGITVCVLRARNLSKYVNTQTQELPADMSLAYTDKRTGQIRPVKTKNSRAHRAVDLAVTVLLILFIGAALALNVFIILISAATPGSEVTISGVIPYVFRSDTMEPSIMLNDLVYFRRIDSAYDLKNDEIVLFKYQNAVFVERIKEKKAHELTVDIDDYPAGSQVGAMVKTVERESIYGVYSGKSRWLGALILFANTIIGRVVFLMIPAVLLFLRKRLTKAGSKSP